MRYDKPLYAAAIGLSGSFVYELYMQAFRLALGFPKYTIFQTNSMMFVNKPSWLIGALTTPLTGILVAFLIYHLTKLYGADYLWIKGGIISMFTWAVVEMVISISGNSILKSVSGNIVTAIGSFITGAFIGYLISKYVMKVGNS